MISPPALPTIANGNQLGLVAGQAPSYFLLSACKDSIPILRNGVTGDWIGSFLGQKGAISCVRLNQLATRALTASADHSACFWDATTGDLLCMLPHDSIVKSCCFIDDNIVATATNNGHILVWNIEDHDSPQIIHEWPANNGAPSCVLKAVILANSSRIISASSDGTLKWWDLSSYSVTNELHCGPGLVQCEATASGDWIVCCYSKKISLFDRSAGDLVRSYDMDFSVSCAAVNPSKTILAVGSVSTTSVYTFDFITGTLIDTLKAHHGPVHSVEFSPDGCILASASEDGTIRLWKMVEGPYGLWE